MRLKFLGGIALALGVLAAPIAAEAQQPAKIARVGILATGPISPRMHLVGAFRQGLRELGYEEGHNVALLIRSPEGGPERPPDLVADLVRLQVDVIVTLGTAGAQAAQQATRTIPIVMAVANEPVETGLVSSLARPGGNTTRLSIISHELSGKRLELLKAVVPRVPRIAVLSNPTNPGSVLQMRETEVAARALRVQLQRLEVRGPGDLEEAFQAATRDRAGALLVFDDSLIFSYRTHIVQLATKSRLPAMYGLADFVEAGGLMAYGVNIPALFRRAATFVDKILKGAKPADLPVEQPTRFEFVINMKTAKSLGLKIPPSVMVRVDQMIE